MSTELGTRLRAARMAITPEITQRDAAKRLGVSPSAVNLWESGKNEPNATNLAELARWYKVSTDWLLGVEAAPQTRVTNHLNEGGSQINTVSVVQPSAMSRWHWDRVESLLQTAQPYVNSTAAAMVVDSDALASVCPRGSFAVVSKGHTPAPGRVVLAVVGASQDPVLRRLIREGGVDMLMADDTRYPSVRMDEGVRIVGVVTEVTTRTVLPY